MARSQRPGAAPGQRRPPRPPRLRRLALALGAALVPAADGAVGVPNWWRLSCNSTTTARWRLCHVRFYADSTCTRAPAASLGQRIHSQADAVTHGLPVDTVFTEFSSACTQCSRGEAYLGVKFSVPAVVQCVRFSECWGAVPGQTTTVWQAPAPPPPPPSGGVGGGGGAGAGATTTTAGPQSTTSDWSGLFNQIGNGFGNIRRLQGASSCTSLMLERSADGFNWRFVGEWYSPQAGTNLNLAQADQRPPHVPPQALSWSPGAVACGACGRPTTGGVQARQVIDITFSEHVYWGSGDVMLHRGGIGSTPLDASMDSNWFQVYASRVSIRPQAPLGDSSLCSSVEFLPEALQNADGQFFTQGAPYTICIADTVPPRLMQTDPLNDASNQDILPRITLEFNEVVRPYLNPAPVELVPVDSPTLPTLSIPTTDAARVRITECSSCALPGMVQIVITTPLANGERYRLVIPGNSISDARGNAWPGTSLVFRTVCGAGGCSTGAAPVPTPTSSTAKEEEESSKVPLYLGIVGGVACCGVGLLVAWKFYVRNYLMPQRGAGKETVPTAPTPAWTAKSGSSSTGWRRSQPTVGGGWGVKPAQTATVPVNVTSPSSVAGSNGTFGNAASRVTASTTSTGPRTAAWAAPEAPPGQAWQPPRPAPAAAGGTPPMQPPQAKARAQTDEDVKQGGGGAAAFANAGKQKSFTTEDSNQNGWVRTVDATSGRTYWYHYKTRETRWDEPPRSGGTPTSPPEAKPSAAPEASGGASSPGGRQKAAGGSAKPEAKAPPSAAKAPEPAPAPQENTRAGRIKADVLEQLEKTKKEDIASRKKTFRFLCLQWHPDKNQEDAELATEVFQFMQLQRDWYLKE